MQNLKNRILEHKKTSILILIITLALIYWIFKLINPTTVSSSYILEEVKKGTIVSTITGTGQVSSLDELKIMPKVAGEITSVNVKQGDHVSRGQRLFSIDARDAQKKVRDAELDLASAQASLKIASEDNARSVDNAYTSLLNSTFEATPNDDATKKIAKPTISGNYILGKEGVITITTYASTDNGVSASFKGLVEDTKVTSSVNASPIGNSGLFILFPSATTTGMSWTISIPNKNASNYISNKLAYEQAIRSQEQSEENTSSALLNLKAKQNALIDARDALSDYYIRALLDGVVASIPVKIGDQATSGTTLATIISDQQIATIPLNEVDIAKVKVGQKVNATFDAVEGLELTGQVLSVDLIGTVTSGIVNYNVKIGFDKKDERIKSGMSTNVSVATAVVQDVLIVPTSAIKTLNGSYYIQIAPKGSVATSASAGIALPEAPEQVEITKGISDDLNTEILKGVKEGDIIVTKTVTTKTSTTATTTAPSILGGATRNASGGATRALR